MTKKQKQAEKQIAAIEQRITEIERNKSFIVPAQKLDNFDLPLECQISKQQKAVYTVIMQLQEEIKTLQKLLSEREIHEFEFLLALSRLELELEALRSTLWLSLRPFFEGWLKPGLNEIAIKENFCLCISHRPNGFEGERKLISLRLPD